MHRFFDEISQDTGKFVFGVADTLQCLDMGAVETLIVWENLEVGLPSSSNMCPLTRAKARHARHSWEVFCRCSSQVWMEVHLVSADP